MYSDDTSISYASKNIEVLIALLNRNLHCLSKWLQGNKLSLNVVKTQAMVIGSRPKLKKIDEKKGKKVDAIFFSIGGSDINLVENVNY